MIVYPNAKINIGLSVTEKRADGFHNIESIFYPIGIKDILEIIPNTGFGNVIFSSSGIEIPGDASGNLCIKAYNLLFNDFKIPSIQMHLHKQIPIGAGLGGGSSDAAFTLKALDELFNLNIPKERLIEYASVLGSDCAFFIENMPTYNFNKGNDFELFDLDMSKYYLILLFPNIHVSTADAYSGINPIKPIENIRTLVSSSIENWKEKVINDFEKSVFSKYPAIKKYKEELYDAGAIYASMSGSGSSVFGIFSETPKLKTSKLPVIWEGQMIGKSSE